MTTKLEQQLAAELALLREALEPFADIRYPDAVPDGAGFASRRNGRHVSYGDIRRARELLRSNGEVRGASRLAGEASASTVVLEGKEEA